MGDKQQKEQEIKRLEEKIRLMKAAYEDFIFKMQELEQEGHEIVNKILKEIDQQKIKKTIEDLNKLK